MTYICYDDRTVDDDDDDDVDVVVIVVYTCMELIRIYMLLHYNTYELSYYWLQYLNGNLVKIKND